MSTTALPPFQVGQIIFLIPSGERRVMPAQITEEILRRTIAGTETVWMIQLAGSQKSVPLDPEAAEYFVSVDVLRNVLVSRTVQQVNTMIDKVVVTASEIFPQTTQLKEEISAYEDSAVEQTVNVLMPDGTRAKVKLP